jgi:N-ethylmaleimide reductase
LNDGQQPVSASALAINDSVNTPQGKLPYVVPRALADDEIPQIIAQFRAAAEHAKAAGFDGVEVHGANGYLLDQFLRDGANRRDGAYGGSLAHRSRLLLEVTDAVIDVWGSGRVGVRISPLNSYNDIADSDPVGLTAHVARELSSRQLAYFHLMRADFLGRQSGDVVAAAREHYRGNLVVNMGYGFDEATQVVSHGDAAAVAFGAVYIANPDLVERFANGWPLAQPDVATFYTQDEEGYTSYPRYAAS